MKPTGLGWFAPGILSWILMIALAGCHSSPETDNSSLPQVTTEILSSLAGNLDDGTAYRIDIPTNWNGTLLLDLDHASRLAERQGASITPAWPSHE